MSSTSPPAEAVQRFRDLMRQSQQLVSKISELEMERNEHKLVEDTLRPLDPSRRAFRLVGGVLVERNVGEVLPSVQQSRENVSTTSALVLSSPEKVTTVTNRLLPILGPSYSLNRPSQRCARSWKNLKRRRMTSRSSTTCRSNLLDSKRRDMETASAY
jgi:chaperonin cofactor prefoldin